MMLKINHKLKIPLLLIPISLGGIFLFQYLTFIPEYSSATEISTEDPIAPVKEWDKLKYMQQMTSEACESVNVNSTRQLIDSRDQKTYWVTKLKDNQCWMTENLDLDITADGLSANDTDIDVDWNQSSTYKPIATQTNMASPSNFSSGDNLVASYDPDEKFCPDGKCTNPPSGNKPSTDIEEHYSYGNYYSWVTATAGTGGGMTTEGKNASGSICPKGWQLPTSNNTNPKSFVDLTSGLSAGSTLVSNSDPYYFVYSGYVNLGNLGDIGRLGRYWSSTVYSSGGAYLLYFDSSLIVPSSVIARYFGLPVRCVASSRSINDPYIPIIPSGSDDNIESPTLSVTVPNIITLSVSNPDTIETKTDDISTGTFTATVNSNTEYKLSLNATTDSTALIGHKENGEPNGASIPAITTNQPQVGVSSWGIRPCTNLTTDSCTTNFLPLPAKNATDSTFTTGHPGANQQTLFQIGIGLSPNLPSGTYSTSITVTASQ